MNEQERKARVLELQRLRRKTRKRLDYYPDSIAQQMIECLRTNRVGGDASSILNNIVKEWVTFRKLTS
jgi:rRNA-processing protein FCF1